MKNFTDFGLSPLLIESLRQKQITTPTPIQAATIPPALNGLDLLASAQTGSGKTVAYLIPLIIHLSTHRKNTALILTPTRELAMQVHQTLAQLFGKTSPFRMALLIGGMPIFKQKMELKGSPQLIIGTPGRITDHLMGKNLSLSSTHFLIIDEADRMLDMGFGIQLDKIAKYLPEVRQTLMFSATLPPNIEKLAKKYLTKPERISIGSSTQAAIKIKQEILHTTGAEKFSELKKQLDQREGSIIVFVKTKRGADRLSRDLKELGYSANAIHGDLSQKHRSRVIHAFREQKCRILVATDVAARGLDVPHVMHVINYNLPECPEDYIHRIGRTGRAEQEGSALCLISPEDRHKWNAIRRMMDPKVIIPQEGKSQEKAARHPGKRPFKNGPRKSRPFRHYQSRHQSRGSRFGN